MVSSIERNIGSGCAGAYGDGNLFFVICLVEICVGKFTMGLRKTLTLVVLVFEEKLEKGVFVDARTNTNAATVSVWWCGRRLPWA